MASPKEEEKESKGSPKEKGHQRAGSFGHIVKEEAKARRVVRVVVQLLNIAEEEVEEEEIEDDALLADKKKRKRKPQAKKKGKAQPAGSAAHEGEATVDEDGFAYSAVSFPYDIISSGPEWCLKGTKGAQEEVEDGTSMILDTGCTKAMCSRHAYLLMRQGLSEDRVELCGFAKTQ